MHLELTKCYMSIILNRWSLWYSTGNNRTTRQNVNKEVEAQNNTINQQNLIDRSINNTQNNKAEKMFFSTAHGTFSLQDRSYLGQKKKYLKFNKIGIIKYILLLQWSDTRN